MRSCPASGPTGPINAQAFIANLMDADVDVVAVDMPQANRFTLHIMAATGCTLDDVVKTTVWLQDARDFALFNKVYSVFFPGDAPARSTVHAELMIDAKIEVEAIAHKPA